MLGRPRSDPLLLITGVSDTVDLLLTHRVRLSPTLHRRRISIPYAIVAGLIWVNGPVLVFLIGTPALVMFGTTVLCETSSIEGNLKGFIALASILPSFVLGFVAAWTWWSFNIPKWRLWAYERVSDVETLKGWAVAVGLTWPDGHIFEKTEIKSEQHRRRERELDPSKAPPTD